MIREAYKDPYDGLRWELKIFIQSLFRETECENFSLHCPMFDSKYLFRVCSRSMVLISSKVKHWSGGIGRSSKSQPKSGIKS